MAKEKQKPDPEDEVEDAELEGELQKKTWTGKKIVLFFGLPGLVVLGGVAAAFFLGLFGGHEAEEGAIHAAEQAEPETLVFYELPELLVNLNSTGRKANYLKLRVSLELADAAAVPLLDARLPRIVDNFQVYLRELRLDDLKGSEGMFRVKEELLARVNTAVQPARVSDVLFKEMLVQ